MLLPHVLVTIILCLAECTAQMLQGITSQGLECQPEQPVSPRPELSPCVTVARHLISVLCSHICRVVTGLTISQDFSPYLLISCPFPHGHVFQGRDGGEEKGQKKKDALEQLERT